MQTTSRTGIRSILQANLPVSDLARSAAFYRDLLGLTYVREFGDGTTITGCALADFDVPYLIALRRRDTLAGGEADLRGEHPVIVEADEPRGGRADPRAGDRAGHPVDVRHARRRHLDRVPGPGRDRDPGRALAHGHRVLPRRHLRARRLADLLRRAPSRPGDRVTGARPNRAMMAG